MKAKIVVLFLAIMLTACASVTTPAPTVVSPTFALAATATYAIPTPSLIPAQPPVPVLTPDAIQVERWREYQTELAMALFSFTPKFPERPKKHDPDEYKSAICEWDILGQSRQEMYVWAVCDPGGTGDLNPAVIYLDANGSIQNVKVFGTVGHLHDLPIYDLDPFPMEVQEKLCLYYLGFTANSQCGDQSNTDRPYILLSHLKYRQTHPDEPPLVILSAIPTVTPAP